MDMNKTFFLSVEANRPEWRLIDAKGQVVGRIATQIADILRGKDTARYTPHTDSGDYVVVINVDQIVFTGKKFEMKTYDTYSGWIGGLKTLTAKQHMEKDPTFVLMHAVKGMLPKTKLADAVIKKLKIYAGAQHPHTAQIASSQAVFKLS